LKPVTLLRLPRSRYGEVLKLQRSIHDEVARGVRCDTWIVVEHEPVVTLGRNAKRSNVLLSAEDLAARGVELVEVERGGDATYHGPGQLVIYPIARLERFREIGPMVSAIEAAVTTMLAEFGIRAGTRPDHRGVYVGDASICAVGLAVRRMTSLHGLALNVSTDLDYDTLIVPCGMPALGITSMERELGHAVDFEQAGNALVASLARAFGVDVVSGFEPSVVRVDSIKSVLR
jgi:lipoate-protein ligase B